MYKINCFDLFLNLSLSVPIGDPTTPVLIIKTKKLENFTNNKILYYCIKYNIY